MTIKELTLLKWHDDCKKTNMPCEYVPKDKFTDKTSNGLTKAICTFINISGGRADRISSAGRYIDNSKMVTDVLGYQRKIGSGKFVKGTTRNGYADVNCTIKGFSVMIEIKMKDKMSEAQHRFAEAERSAGGQYWLVHSFEEFILKYNEFIKGI